MLLNLKLAVGLLLRNSFFGIIVANGLAILLPLAGDTVGNHV